MRLYRIFFLKIKNKKMKQKFELFKQDVFWTDAPEDKENVEMYVYFECTTTEQIEECHGFPQKVYFQDIQIIEAKVKGKEATVFETECIYQEISFLNLSNYKTI